MEREIRARLRWVKLLSETGNATLVCRRCGVSRPTLRKWLRRFEEEGVEGLIFRSRRPTNSPPTKIQSEHEKWILEPRQERKLGARRIQTDRGREFFAMKSRSG